jgi:hypothetical protein
VKTKFLLIYIFAVLVTLTGCKPNETLLTGQMFIVTQGAENVKLGDVEILLIEKSQVTVFLQKKQYVIDAEIASRQQDLTDAKDEINKAQTNYVSFLQKKPYQTNENYVKIGSQLAVILKLKNTFQRQYDALDINAKSAESDASYDVDKYNTLLNQRTSVQQSLDIENKVAASLQEKLDDIKSSAEAEKNNILNSAVSRAANAETKLKNYPTAEDCLSDFLPAVIKKTISDSDGKFSFSYPHNKSFAIFARAQRKILSKTETYYWIIDTPTNMKTARILLSNNNLVTVDQDGYFKLKLKEASEASSAQ